MKLPAFVLLALVPTLALCEERRASPVADSSFEFQFGQGSGRYGLDLLKVKANGECIYEYREARYWMRKHFVVEKAVLERLIETVDDLRIRDLERVYSSGKPDGRQWCVLIKSGGKSKSIYCDNRFPPQIEELSKFVHDTIIKPYAKNLDAEEVPKAEYRRHEKEIWASIK